MRYVYVLLEDMAGHSKGKVVEVTKPLKVLEEMGAVKLRETKTD